MNQNKLREEINSFQKLWNGGYRTGYSEKRGQKRLEDYLRDNLVGNNLLEIGSGGGQWTKFIYELNIFQSIQCVDVLSAEHNSFWEYMGEESKKKVKYKQNLDFSLDHIENNSIDYVFSYDVFCHISQSGVEAYLKSLNKKCKPGSKLLIMYADPAKYINSEPENRNHVIQYLPEKKFIYKLSNNKLIKDALKDSNGKPFPGRWYWVGIKNFLNLAETHNFKIEEQDLNIDYTNPITLLRK